MAPLRLSAADSPAAPGSSTSDLRSPEQTSDLRPPTSEQALRKIIVGDAVEIKVYQEDELNTKARLDKDGSVIFPLLGPIRLADRSTHEAAREIEELLKRDYLYDPQVTVTITDYAKQRFSILGQVGRPGTFEIPTDRSLTLLQAISMAGGFTRISNPNKISVKRLVDGKEQIFKLDAEAMAKRKNEKVFEVLPDDIINVPESLF